MWESPGYQRLLYCGYDVTFSTPHWQVLRPSPAGSRCGTAVATETGPVPLPANQPVAVPRQDGAITLVTITPRQSILGQVIGLLAKPRAIFVTYGPNRWRLAENPSAERLMLNAPIAQPAFSALPNVPYATLSVSQDADAWFVFMPVASGAG